MPTITCDLRPIWPGADQKSYILAVDGHTICGVTEETGEAPVLRLKALYEANANILLAAVEAANERRQWNIDHPGEGRNWPAFTVLEKLRSRLQREAGIIDS